MEIRFPAPGLEDATLRARFGAKGASLVHAARAGFTVPAWFALAPVRALDAQDVHALHAALEAIAPQPDARFAVRSSAPDEDGARASYAGAFASVLDVAADDVAAAIEEVRASADSASVREYRMLSGVAAPAQTMVVLVQRMIAADAAGVAFSADPASGRRGVVVINAVHGTGAALLAGHVRGDHYEIGANGPSERATPAGADAVLCAKQVAAIARIAREAERYAGRPQDVEFAIAGAHCFVLQMRPITTLTALADPDAATLLWDNSNIAESYSGVTTPLTYTFARYAYAAAYRSLLRSFGVNERTIAAHDRDLEALLGLVRGRMYYNIIAWFRLLAILPGFRFNRRFMEQMMGVREPLPEPIVADLARAGARERARDLFALVSMVVRLASGALTIERRTRAFLAEMERFPGGSDAQLERARLDELAAAFRHLEGSLIERWETPLLNDHLTMIWCGISRALGDPAPVGTAGAMVSAQPAGRVRKLAYVAAADPPLAHALNEGSADQARTLARNNALFATLLEDYITRFGARCAGELKLESVPYDVDPTPLLRSIGALARLPSRAGDAPASASEPISLLRSLVMGEARRRIVARENMRFERARVFNRVRAIFCEIGKRLWALDVLDDPRDVFFLELGEVLGFIEGSTTTTDLRGLCAIRKREFAAYTQVPAPAGRFTTALPVHRGNTFCETVTALHAAPPAGCTESHGIASSPGNARGRVRVVRDLCSDHVLPGEILVAERTDPSWVIAFAAAGAVLVENGSLLSHAAIVTRELGIPSIVGIEGLTQWLATGDVVEVDARSGIVRKIAPALEAADAR